MIRSWRTPLLLTILFLIALILVLPQVDLPDYVSSDIAAAGSVRPHPVDAPVKAALAHAIQVWHFVVRPVFVSLVATVGSWTHRSVWLATPELRC